MTKQLPKTNFARNTSNLLILDLEERLELKLVDEDKKPFANKKYQIRCKDDSLINGALDNTGYALIEGENLEGATVTFPDFDTDDWVSEDEFEKEKNDQKGEDKDEKNT
jgi:hypothetical protein